MERRRFLFKALFWLGATPLYLKFLFHSKGENLAKALAMGAVAPASAWARHSHLSLREIASRKLHHRGERFFNPFIVGTSALPHAQGRHGSLWRFLYWKLIAKNKFSHLYHREEVRPVTIDWNEIEEKKGLAITFIKHATLLIKDAGRYILIDPVFLGLFPFIRDFTPLFGMSSIPSIDYLLITHGHYDHLDIPSIRSLPNSPHAIAPLGYEGLLHRGGVKEVLSLDWFQYHEMGGLRITLLPCYHWTMRNPFKGVNTALWGSFLIETETGPTVFISGDTAYFQGFKELGEEYSVDLAIFNLGAYEPRWFMKHSHLNPQEVITAFQDLKARHLMVVHWGTFRLGDEPVFYPPLELKGEMERAGILDRFIPLYHGQTLSYPATIGADNKKPPSA